MTGLERRCAEEGCAERVQWFVNTAAGWLPFCGPHSEWYRQRSPDVYQVQLAETPGERRMPTVQEFVAMGPERTTEWHRQSGIAEKIEEAIVESDETPGEPHE